MSAIQQLLQRWGFVKLGRYGLTLTPEGRVLSMRPEVLQDDAGGRIVGWQDHDLAMAELKPWEPARPEAVKPAPVAPGVAVAPSAVAVPSYPQVISEASLMAQPAIESSAGVMAAPVADEPVVDEDDWEWTIAIARARSADDDVPAVSPGRTPAVTAATRVPSKVKAPATQPMPAAVPPRERTRPIAVVASKDPARAAQPHTVIPVPALPTMQSSPGRLEPVVRAAQGSSPSVASSVPPASMSRFAKGTGEVLPRQPSTAASAAPMTDDTVPNLAIGDRTTPGIAMPMAARAVQLPSVKRRALQRG